MSQSDFSVKVNGQTKKEAGRWTKEPSLEQRQNTFTDFLGKYLITYICDHRQLSRMLKKTHINNMIYCKYTYGNVRMIYI